MELKQFDNKKVVIEDIYGDKYEGICLFYNEEYNEHEFGVSEDSLEISNTIFYQTQIKKVKVIKKFSSNYGKLEELIIKSGFDMIEEVLENDEKISIFRLLCCIKNNVSFFSQDDKLKLIKSLETLANYHNDSKIRNKASEILMILKNDI